MPRDRGSTIPLILGFFVIAFLVVGGSVALGDAFVQQRNLQDVCDGAAAAAAASAVDLRRGEPDPMPVPAPVNGGTASPALPLTGVDAAVAGYLARDPDRQGVTVRAELSPDRRTLTLHCRETSTIAFGAVVGNPTVTHTATSATQALEGS